MTDIVVVPAPVLRQRCVPIEVFNSDTCELGVRLMRATDMYGRIGVAAPQIGEPVRAFCIKFEHDHNLPRVFINPLMTAGSGSIELREGCLSAPGRWFQIKRADWVRVTAVNEAGKKFSVEVDGRDAQALQHELDHLDGILICDRVREQLPGMIRQQRRVAERELAKNPW